MGKKSKEKTTKSIGKVMRNMEKTNETKAKESREKKKNIGKEICAIILENLLYFTVKELEDAPSSRKGSFFLVELIVNEAGRESEKGKISLMSL